MAAKNIRKLGFSCIVICPTFKVGTQGDTALWPDDVWSLRPQNFQLAQGLSQLTQGLVSPGWGIMEKEPVATACLIQRHQQQRSSTAAALQHRKAAEPHCFLLHRTEINHSAGVLPPLRWFSSTGGGCCELSHLWLNHFYLGGWSEGQGQLLPKETRVHHIRVLTDPLFIQRTWIEYILYAGYCKDTETRREAPDFQELIIYQKRQEELSFEGTVERTWEGNLYLLIACFMPVLS